MAISLNIARRKTRNYDAGNFQLIKEYIESMIFPIGSIIAKLSDTETGDQWIRVYGQELLKADYPDLYAEIGGLFGETPTTFKLPDLTDTYLSGAGSSTAGAFLGNNSVVLTEGQLPPHAHGVGEIGLTVWGEGRNEDILGGGNAGSGTLQVITDDAGSGEPVDNRPKSIAVHYFIKAKQ